MPHVLHESKIVKDLHTNVQSLHVFAANCFIIYCIVKCKTSRFIALLRKRAVYTNQSFQYFGFPDFDNDKL